MGSENTPVFPNDDIAFPPDASRIVRQESVPEDFKTGVHAEVREDDRVRLSFFDGDATGIIESVE